MKIFFILTALSFVNMIIFGVIILYRILIIDDCNDKLNNKILFIFAISWIATVIFGVIHFFIKGGSNV